MSSSGTPWQERIVRANQDRVFMARFWGIVVCLTAFVNLIPVVYLWLYPPVLVESQPLARWVYWQIFLAALHLVYAVLLLQVPDWSTLRGIANYFLVVAFMLGIVSAGLFFGQAQGLIAEFIGVSAVSQRSATHWNLAMLCLSILIAYGCGKEANTWQRAESLLRQIVSRD